MKTNCIHRVRQAILAPTLAAVVALGVGCNDDTPTVTVDADNYEDLAVSTSEAVFRASMAPFLLMSLGYIIDTGETPDSALAGESSATSGPGAGSASFECEGGTFDLTGDEDGWTATLDECGIGYFECYVSGQLILSDAVVDEASGLEFRANDLEFDCPGLEDVVAFDGDRVTCPLPIDDVEDCELDLRSFTAPHSGRRMGFGDIVAYGDPFSPAFALMGEVVDGKHGRMDIGTESEFDFGCDLMPSEGILIFGGTEPTLGSIEYDEECEVMQVCLWPDDEFEEPSECTLVPYPGADPPV